MGEGLVLEALEALMPLEFYEVTPEEFEKDRRLYLFDASYRYSVGPRGRKTGRPTEVAAWDRSAVRVEVAKPDPKTTLRIEPLDGGEAVRLAGPSTADDPWSLAVMALLDPGPTSARVR